MPVASDAYGRLSSAGRTDLQRRVHTPAPRWAILLEHGLRYSDARSEASDAIPAVPRRSSPLEAAGSRWSGHSSLLDDYVLSLTDAAARASAFCRPPPATPTTTSCASTAASPPSCDASHVSLFRRDQGTGGVEDDLATHLLAQDLIYVGGGNVV